jgi:hypothetical protein
MRSSIVLQSFAAAPRRLSAWYLELAPVSQRRVRVIVILIVALLPIVWLYPFNTILYGTDSYHFVNPFSYNFDTLRQYGYLTNPSFPVPDSAPLFYIEGFTFGLGALGLPYFLVQRVAILVGSLVGTVGIYRLTGTLNRIAGRGVISGFAPRTLVALVYLMNPYTLSLIWWHFGNYSLFYLFLPFLLSTCLQACYFLRVPVVEYSILVVLGILLAPGLSGGFAIAVAFVIVYFVLIILVRSFQGSIHWKTATYRITALVTLAVALLAWTVLPYVLIPNYQLTSTGYLTGSNTLSSFYAESATTSLWNVSRLVAYSWLYFDSSAYPWIAWFPVVSIVAAFVPAALAVGVLLGRRMPGVAPLAILGLAVLAFTIGSNPPTGSLNRWLVGIGGPFAVLADGYYVLGEIYVVIFCALGYIGLVSASRVFASATNSCVLSKEGSHSPGTSPRDRDSAVTRHRARWRYGVSRPAFATLFIGLFVGGLLVFSAPFITDRVYQSEGSNIDSFVVPPSYFELQSYFAGTGSSGSFYVLMLPLSSAPGSYYASINNQSYDDSTNLLASFIPYPLIWCNNSPTATGLENLFTWSGVKSVLPVLQELSIGWVVYNPYVESTSYYSTHAPNGQLVNESWILSLLEDDLGAPKTVGEFKVFVVPNATRILSVRPNLTISTLPTYEDYLHLLASFGPNDQDITQVLSASLWAPAPVHGTGQIEYSPVASPSNHLTLPSGVGIALVNQTGFGVPVPDTDTGNLSSGVYLSPNRTSLSVTDSIQESLANSSTIVTNMLSANGSYYTMGHADSYLTYANATKTPSVTQLDMRLPNLTTQNWIDLDLVAGSLEIVTELYLDPLTSHYNLGSTAYYVGRPYAWDDVLLAGDSVPSELNVTQWVNASAIDVEVSGPQVAPSALTLNFSRGSFGTPSDWRNLSNAPKTEANLQNATESIQTFNASVEVPLFDVFAQNVIVGVLTSSYGFSAVPVATSTSTDLSGNFHVTIDPVKPVEGFYIVLNYPSSYLWLADSDTTEFERIGAIPFQNVFTNTTPSVLRPGVTVEFTVSFNVSINDGLYASWAELAIVIFLPLVVVILNRRRRGRCAS